MHLQFSTTGYTGISLEKSRHYGLTYTLHVIYIQIHYPDKEKCKVGMHQSGPIPTENAGIIQIMKIHVNVLTLDIIIQIIYPDDILFQVARGSYCF